HPPPPPHILFSNRQKIRNNKNITFSSQLSHFDTSRNDFAVFLSNLLIILRKTLNSLGILSKRSSNLLISVWKSKFVGGDVKAARRFLE
ncbi:MAG: hypothetical protein FWC97_01650, partial [Treponema sp.]|nr:hypothetical protein [Treponema sp.]